jgi:putative RecB family exonuclease
MSQLGFDFGVQQPRKLVKVSPARLANFDGCARRYRMAYLDRPQPRRTGPWAHSTLGAVVHNALRNLFDLPTAKRLPHRAAALVVEHWKDAGFADAEQAGRYRGRAKRWIAEYVEQNDVSADPVGLERWVSAPVSPGEDAKPSMIIEGRADRIDQRDGELVIVDYKTGRRPPDEHDARSSQALAIYAVAASHTLRKPCRKVELHHLPSGTIAAAEHTEESLRRQLVRAGQTAEDLRVAADTLEEGGDAQALFPASTGKHCSWCDFRPSCAEGQQAALPAQPWELLAP